MKNLTIVLVLTFYNVVVNAAEVSVSDAVVRGMPPGQKITAAFAKLHNNGSEPCEMISVATDVAERAELHNHIHEEGMMKMRRVHGVDVPAGETVVFKPGGLHIMIFGLKRDLSDGETVSMSIGFKQCDQVVVNAVVRSAKKSHAHHH